MSNSVPYSQLYEEFAKLMTENVEENGDLEKPDETVRPTRANELFIPTWII